MTILIGVGKSLFISVLRTETCPNSNETREISVMFYDNAAYIFMRSEYENIPSRYRENVYLEGYISNISKDSFDCPLSSYITFCAILQNA